MILILPSGSTLMFQALPVLVDSLKTLSTLKILMKMSIQVVLTQSQRMSIP